MVEMRESVHGCVESQCLVWIRFSAWLSRESVNGRDERICAWLECKSVNGWGERVSSWLR